jgi:hypothetical protein
VADRAPSLAEEAHHLHACLFRGSLHAVVVARYEAAHRELGIAASPAVQKVVARRLDAEAVEYALRRRAPGAALTRKMQVLCYLVEVHPGYLSEFVNQKSSRVGAWAALLRATLRSGWKRLKGEYLVRRHGLV